MTRCTVWALATALLFTTPLPTSATARCRIQLSTETRGFLLNPTLARARVSAAVPPAGRTACELQVGDELVRINTQPVEGQKARTVMAYWESLPTDAPRHFTVRRGGQLVQVTVP